MGRKSHCDKDEFPDEDLFSMTRAGARRGDGHETYEAIAKTTRITHFVDTPQSTNTLC